MNTSRAVEKATLQDQAQQLCLQCGLCCDGSIFANVRLRAGDDPERLRQAGLALRDHAKSQRFGQPCPMLEGCHCRIYLQRPNHCRTFACGVLKRLDRGEISLFAAAREVRTARRLVHAVRRKLRALRDQQDTLPIAARIRHTSRRLANGGGSEKEIRLYGDLTLAAHQMSLRLSQSFYPGGE